VSRLGELHAKVEAFFARVEARHGEDMQCRTGCADCCRVRLSITGAEAAAIREEVAGWPGERRRTLAEAVPPGEGAGGDRCAALDAADRCRIYAVRPIVCRSHGAPIRMHRASLPVVESCSRNFTRTEPAADCILDQTTLSALTLAVDRAAGGDGSRVDLAALLAEQAAS
jgi:hypothetical protein